MENKKEENENEENTNIIKYPPKKFLDIVKDKNDIISFKINILTNLSCLGLNNNEIKDVYLFGCDIEEQSQISEDLNNVHVMRMARKLQCFHDEIKKYVTDYYISGLILIGRKVPQPENTEPSENTEKNKKHKRSRFYFYLQIKENKNGKIEGKIIIDPKNESKSDSSSSFIEKIYKFKFKQKKRNLLEMKETKETKKIGDKIYINSFLNICLGKILKKLDYYKDRTSRKGIYYDSNQYNIQESQSNNKILYFPGLKAVCETYEKGNIYMKLLPKKIIKTLYTYEDYFYFYYEKVNKKEIKFEEFLLEFKKKVFKKRGIKIYNQAMIKIDDIIFDNPYKIEFIDKKGKNKTIGEYFYEQYNIKINDVEMPIAIRKIDKGGKLKGDDIKYIYIPCFLLETIGNVFDEKINVKDFIQKPNVKYNEINEYRYLIENKSRETGYNNELHNYLGDKFNPLFVEGQVIKPPLIKFGNNKISEPNLNGIIEIRGTSPYCLKNELNNVDIYYLDLNIKQISIIWEYLKQASVDLGIKLNEKPNFFKLDYYENEKDFEKYLNNYFNQINEKYIKKEEKIENKIDFIFMFMDSTYKNSFYYKIFKSEINKIGWVIPTQVILYDSKFEKNANLSQFTNILCQMWAKKGRELYICDFDFIPNTIVIAYSSIKIQDEILTSICISYGFILYE